MNKIIKKNFSKHPFLEMEKQNAPWIDSVRTSVNTYVVRMEKLIKMEAEFEGQPELANDDFLYERFVDNCASGMSIANWTVLKFFLAKLKIKIAKEVIGEWLYNEHDVEMYRYFHSLNVNINTKCQPKFLKFKSGVDNPIYALYENIYTTACIYTNKTTSEDYNMLMVPFFSFFDTLFNCIDNLVKSVKMLQTYNDVDMFDTKRYVTTASFAGGCFDSMANACWKRSDVCSDKPAVIQESVATIADVVCKAFLERCNQNDKYRALHDSLSALTEELYNEFRAETKSLLGTLSSDMVDVIEKTAIIYASGVNNT